MKNKKHALRLTEWDLFIKRQNTIVVMSMDSGARLLKGHLLAV